MQKKTPEFEKYVKKGGGVRILSKRNNLLEIVTRGQGGFIEERSLKQRGLIFSSRQNKYFSLFFN